MIVNVSLSGIRAGCCGTAGWRKRLAGWATLNGGMLSALSSVSVLQWICPVSMAGRTGLGRDFRRPSRRDRATTIHGGKGSEHLRNTHPGGRPDFLNSYRKTHPTPAFRQRLHGCFFSSPPAPSTTCPRPFAPSRIELEPTKEESTDSTPSSLSTGTHFTCDI